MKDDSARNVSLATGIAIFLLIVISFSSQLITPTFAHWNFPFLSTSNSQASAQSNNSNNNAEERLTMRSLMQEHAVVAAIVTENRYENNPDFQASQNLALQNGQQISAEIGKLYGSDIQGQFQSLWIQHLDLFVQYADALKNKDQNAQANIVNQLNTWTDSISTLLGNKYPNAKTVLSNMFHEHVTDEKSIIDAHASGDYNGEYANLHNGYIHAGMMGDVLSNLSVATP